MTFCRFNLVRRFDYPVMVPGRRMLFVMLNPSTATDTVDDPTVRRCRGFAMSEDCEFMEIINLFAWRSTNPYGLKDQPFRPNNFEITQWHKSLERKPWRIVAAWGDTGPAWLKNKIRTRIPVLLESCNMHGRIMHSLGTTNSGMPRHPLYLRSDSELKTWFCPELG